MIPGLTGHRRIAPRPDNPGRNGGVCIREHPKRCHSAIHYPTASHAQAQHMCSSRRSHPLQFEASSDRTHNVDQGLEPLLRKLCPMAGRLTTEDGRRNPFRVGTGGDAARRVGPPERPNPGLHIRNPFGISGQGPTRHSTIDHQPSPRRLQTPIGLRPPSVRNLQCYHQQRIHLKMSSPMGADH